MASLRPSLPATAASGPSPPNKAPPTTPARLSVVPPADDGPMVGPTRAAWLPPAPAGLASATAGPASAAAGLAPAALAGVALCLKGALLAGCAEPLETQPAAATTAAVPSTANPARHPSRRITWYPMRTYCRASGAAWCWFLAEKALRATGLGPLRQAMPGALTHGWASVMAVQTQGHDRPNVCLPLAEMTDSYHPAGLLPYCRFACARPLRAVRCATGRHGL
jgi:hypothetical protein